MLRHRFRPALVATFGLLRHRFCPALIAALGLLHHRFHPAQIATPRRPPRGCCVDGSYMDAAFDVLVFVELLRDACLNDAAFVDI